MLFPEAALVYIPAGQCHLDTCQVLQMSPSTSFCNTPIPPSVALTQGTAASPHLPRLQCEVHAGCALLPTHAVSTSVLMTLKPISLSSPPSPCPAVQSFITAQLHHCNASETALSPTTVPTATEGPPKAQMCHVTSLSKLL